MLAIVVKIISVLAVWAEHIAVWGEQLLLLIFGWVHQLRERVLLTLIRRFWPRWISADVLTGSRVVIGVTIAALLWHNDVERTAVIALFILGLVTELFDGSVARAFNPNPTPRRAAFGSFFDKLADRLLYLPLVWFEYWRYPEFWVRFILVGATLGGLIALFWQFINWVRTDPREVPENFASKLSAICYIPVALIPLLWPAQWRWGFYCSLAATVLAIGSLWRGGKAIGKILLEDESDG